MGRMRTSRPRRLDVCILECVKIVPQLEGSVTQPAFFSFPLSLLIDSGEFELVGADHPGIVHRITTALTQAGLSIDRMETVQEIAPHGGSVLFKMHGTAIALAPLPKHFDIRKIKSDLSELGDSLNCDVVMEDTVEESVEGSFYAG